jgi:competence protein ComEC
MLSWRYTRVRRTTLIGLFALGCLVGIGSVQLGFSVFDISLVFIAFILIILSFKKRAFFAVPAVLLAGIIFGLWRGSGVNTELNTLQSYVGQKVILSGTIVNDPEYGKRKERQFRLNNLTLDGKPMPGQIRVSTFAPYMFYRGDAITLKGKLSSGFGNYQAKLSFAEVVEIKKGNDPWVAIRDSFAAGVRNALPEPAASLGIGFLLGQRSALPADLDDKLRIVGLTHIVVASGYNLTVLVRVARRLFAPVSKYQAIIVGGGLMMSFVFITGFTPSMTRAALVTGLSLLAWYYGRKIHPIVLLLFTAALTGMFNPFYVWSDIGWWLSFLAFAGVLILSPLLQKRIWGDKQPSFISQVTLETVAAQILTLPLIIFVFGQVSVVSVVANMLVVPLIPFAMLFTAIAGFVGLVFPILAGASGIIAEFIMGYMLGVVNILSSVSFAQIDFQIDVIAMIALFAAIAILCFFLWRRTKYDFLEQSIVD